MSEPNPPPATAAGSRPCTCAKRYLNTAAGIAHTVRVLDTVIERTRTRIDQLGTLDPVSQDLLIGIVAGLEKQRWMFDAQQA